MFTTMQHHASHHFLPSEAHPLNNRAPSLSTSKSKLRKLTSMASFTKPLNVFHRRRTTNNLTSSTSTGSFQSNSDAPTQSMQRSSTFQGPLHTASEHSSYRSSDVSANSSVTSLGRARTDNDDTPRKAPRHEDHGTQETPRRPPWPRRVTSLEQQQWADSHGIDHKEEPTPTKSSRLDNCPLRKAFKEAHTPSQYRASSRITGTQRRDIPSKTPQLITPKRTPNAKSHTPFEHQRYFTDPGRTGSSKAPRRDSSTRIEQRQLLQPLPPPLPKSQTMGGFMSGSGELAIDIIRSQPSSRRGSLRASFHSISSLTDSDVSLTSSLHSRPSLGPTREYSAPVSQLRVPLVRLRPSPIPILRNCPSLGGNDEYTTPPRKRPSLSGIDEYTTPVRRGRPLSGVFEEYRSPKQIGRPSTDEDKTPRARLRKKHSADGDFKESIYAMQIRQITEAMPSAYWCGRFMTLNDRFRNEEFKVEDRHVDEDDAETQRYSLSADELRVRRVFIHLTSLCQTEEARESLMDFQERYAIRNQTPAAAPMGGTLREKTSFFDKIMGKRDIRKEVEKGTGGKMVW